MSVGMKDTEDGQARPKFTQMGYLLATSSGGHSGIASCRSVVLTRFPDDGRHM